MFSARRPLAALLAAVLLAPAQAWSRPAERSARQEPADPGTAAGPFAALDAAVAAAEGALRDGELQLAESRYRDALFEGWMLLGALSLADGRRADARAAFERAAASTFDAGPALQALAIVQIQSGAAAEAAGLLTRLLARRPSDLSLRILLARALVAAGEPAQAVQELEEAHTAGPDDLEVTFNLATGYLQLGKMAEAERLFGELARARAVPQTHVLIGRTYRDAGEYDRARKALETALRMDPRTRRARYYLGTIDLMSEGTRRLDQAIAHFRAELKLEPSDPMTNLRLGMALVDAREADAALPHLQVAAESPSTPADTFYYLGRAQLAVDRAPEAVTSLRRAVALMEGAADPSRLAAIQYQLAVALRRTGATEEAAALFAATEETAAQEVEEARERLQRYLTDTPEAQPATAPAVPMAGGAALTKIPAAEREAIDRRLRTALTRAYFNLGVMHAQASRFLRAAECFEGAAGVDPEFPRVQYSLGVAYFNAQKYDKAVAPLEREVGAEPGNADARRMLALSWVNLEQYDKAAALLADDERRERDPALQYVYGMALVRSGRAAEAEDIFSRLLAAHGDRPELHVVLGQAHAQQGDFDAAIAALRRALELKADVPEANATLGGIYLRQGRLAEAASALTAELGSRPDDARARFQLATVLDLEGRTDEAIAAVRETLRRRPEFADARYLLGKMLLARGAAAEAVQHLEAAARLAPDEAHVHFQLAQAYRRLERTELAEKAFARYQELKEKRDLP